MIACEVLLIHALHRIWSRAGRKRGQEVVEVLRVALGAPLSAGVDMNCSVTGEEMGSSEPLVFWLVILLTHG